MGFFPHLISEFLFSSKKGSRAIKTSVTVTHHRCFRNGSCCACDQNTHASPTYLRNSKLGKCFFDYVQNNYSLLRHDHGLQHRVSMSPAPSTPDHGRDNGPTRDQDPPQWMAVSQFDPDNIGRDTGLAQRTAHSIHHMQNMIHHMQNMIHHM